MSILDKILLIFWASQLLVVEKKYLGVPESFGRKKKQTLKYIYDNVGNKVAGWHNRFLTPAGKEILLKAVAQAMPVFTMNDFELPVSLCSEIDSILSKFWWGSHNGKRKMSWVSWKKMSVSKAHGGLGFRDIRKFNQALLANQIWKLSSRKQSLVYRVLKHRYFKNGDIWNAKKGHQSSYGWKSLLHGRELLLQGTQSSIGNGKQTCLSDAWLPTYPPRCPTLFTIYQP